MNGTILWVDDEIELLKAYVIFLEKKDYQVVTATNGQDAIDLCREKASTSSSSTKTCQDSADSRH